MLLRADNLEVEWDAGTCAVPDGLVRFPSSSLGRRTQALNPGFSLEGGIRAYDATGAPSITTSWRWGADVTMCFVVKRSWSFYDEITQLHKNK